MRIIRILSIIGLAAYLILAGIYLIGDQESPEFLAFIGAVGLATGVLMFISLGHWIDFRKEKR